MPDLAYDVESGQKISVQEESGGFRLHSEKIAPPNLTVIPHIHRDQLAISNDDVYIVDSVKSGNDARSEQLSVFGRILRPLLELLEVHYTYVPTVTASTIAEFGASLESHNRPITIVIISGDTSINELINSLSPGRLSRMKILVVPAGTGNSLALSIGLTDELAAVKKLISYQDHDVRPLNLYEVQFPVGSRILNSKGTAKELTGPHLFVVVASWAFHASLVADSDTEELRKFGIDRFKMAAQANLARPQVYDGDVAITRYGAPTVSHTGPFAYFVITPSKKFEPTFEILPKGNIFDSNLYLVGFPSENSDSYIMDLMNEVYAGGKHVENAKVFYDLIEKDQQIELHIRNTSPETNRFCVDGAIVVVPQGEGLVRVRFHGPTTNGWNVGIIS